MLSKLKLPWTLLMGLILIFAVAACDNDDDDMLINEDMSIIDVIEDDVRFTTLVNAIQRTGLDAILGDRSTNLTLFAPTDDAFEALNMDLSTLTDEELRGILLYHVYGDGVTSNRILDGKTYLSTMSNTGPGEANLSIYIEKGGSNLMINGEAAVTDPDITTENGVIHAINTVLTPFDVVEHLQANDDFSELVTALSNASGELSFALAQEDQVYTIFAPNNQAFQAISSTVEGLTADELAAVLLYHVIPSQNAVSTSLTDEMLTTLQGEGVTVDVESNSVMLTDANGKMAQVVFVNIQGTNGVVHIIDEVLMPSNI